MTKTLIVKQQNESGMTGDTREFHAESIEKALKDLGHEVKQGNLDPPFTVEFQGPNSLQFTVTVDSAADAHEISTMGFMF